MPTLDGKPILFALSNQYSANEIVPLDVFDPPRESGNLFARKGRQRSTTERGITLLEVLIAVGVLTIGLLSLASLIPIGKYQLAEAAKFDRGSSLGRAAFRTLQVGQWLRPAMWLYAPASGNAGNPVISSNRFMPFSSSAGVAQPPMVPLVLDPLMIGMNNPTYVAAANPSGQKLVQTFPYGVGMGSPKGPEGVAPIIPRITLRNVPGPLYARVNSSMQPLTPGGAERLFRGTDDLVFNNAVQLQTSSYMSVNAAGAESGETFVSANNAPTAQYVGATGISMSAITMSQGDYSWLVTIQPDVSQVFGGQGQSGCFYKSNAGTTQQFQASVVVFQKRPLIPLASTDLIPGTVNINQTVDPNARGERMVFVDFISRGGVRFRTNSNLVQNVDDAAKYLSVRANEWILVTGLRHNARTQIPNPYASSTSGWPEVSLHWYQVITCSAPQTWRGQWFVDAVVVGDDWTQNGAMGEQFWLYQDQDGFGYNDYQNPPTGVGTLLTGAIGVFTKTITLDSSSRLVER